MNIQLLSFAELFYQLHGFQKIEVPWTVSKEVSDLTKPANRHDFFLKQKVLVGSAEQSFLEEYFSGNLKKGRYMATTPCFRDEEVLDDLHRQYFMKTELIEIGEVTEKNLEEIIRIAESFFSQFVPVKIADKGDGTYDIESKNTNIELGSYGIREFKLNNKHIKYVFATGCALPRLSQVITLEKSVGYHKDLEIPKSQLGSILKVFEEMYELEDAVLEKQNMLALCELADIMGAIKLYLKQNHTGISLSDLCRMSCLTSRAFKSGSR